MTTLRQAEGSYNLTVNVGKLEIIIRKFLLPPVFDQFERRLIHPLKRTTIILLSLKEWMKQTWKAY